MAWSDDVSRDAYSTLMRAAIESAEWMGLPAPPVHGPPEPEPDTVLLTESMWVQRRCNGDAVVSFWELGYGWERLSHDDTARLVAVLGEWS